MRIKSIAKFLFVATLATTTISCDEEFTEMGSDIIDSDQFGFDKYIVKNINTENVEGDIANTRNLPIHNFGVYTHSAFGKTEGHFVTQLEMKDNSSLTSIGSNPVLDSVYVYIPFTSTVTSTDSDGNRTYNVSNIYGNGKFTLNVYENGYYLRNSDPNNDFETQFYYADEKKLFDNHKKGLNGTNRLNNAVSSLQNTEFQFNKSEIKLFKYNSDGTPQNDDNGNHIVKERLEPGVWLDLDKAYFQEKFFANNKYQTIINNGILKEYFRGLYFEAIDSYNQNALAQLDLTKGKVVFVYKQDGTVDTETNQPKRDRKTLEFNIGFDSSSSPTTTATTVNLLENNFDLENNSFGNIWLKGGGNSTYATISLFGNDSDNNGKADELDEIITNNWLINQALLTLYVDHAATGLDTISSPKQLYLYDIKNNKVLTDYIVDGTTTKSVYGGALNTKNKSIHKYQFKITNHVNNLIQKDSTNVPLGLVVANDINNVTMNPVRATDKKLPLTTVMNPFGTVIYAPNASNSDLQMKLEIYYTKEK